MASQQYATSARFASTPCSVRPSHRVLLLVPASSSQDQVCDLLWVRDQRKVACIELHACCFHACCQKSFQVRGDRLIEFRDRIPAWFGAPSSDCGPSAEQGGSRGFLLGIKHFCLVARDAVREILDKGFLW